ncbi:MAG: RNA methyltransferase [Desulfovibrionaceae bacterium]|nr:RNA methyltransferase [Desulfovibrionaceae bacterium]
MEISSANNPRFKSWLKVLDSRGARKQGEAILAGKKFWNEVLKEHPERVRAVLCPNTGVLPAADAPVYTMPAELFGRLDIYGTNAPLLLISAPEPPLWQGELAQGLTLFLPFQNPINLGTTIRSAAAFGARVVVMQEAACVYHPKTLRAAGPAIFKTEILQGPDLPSLSALAAQKALPIFALGLNGKNLFDFNFPRNFGLAAGLEGPGLEGIWPRENMLTIPMRPGVESLNAAAAVDISMGAILARRKAVF